LPAPLRLLAMTVDWAAVVMGGGIVCLVFLNVVMHQIDLDIAWTTELSQVLMVWVTFVGGAAAGRRGEHVAITELVDLLPARLHRWAEGLAQLVAAAVLALLVWKGIGIAQSASTDHLSVLGWPMSVEYLGLPVGSAATLVFVLFDLTEIARGVPRAERYGE
jgi:TRAP-type C4-dicarboxylate transport system permease small subunit